MKSLKKLQIPSHPLFVYINNQDRKLHMSVLVFSSALVMFPVGIKERLSTAARLFCRAIEEKMKDATIHFPHF